MQTTIENIDKNTLTLSHKFKAYYELLKPRLSYLVAFSAIFGYLLASQGSIDWITLIGLALGGFLVSGSSLIVNQILERDLDKMMERTKNRPIPSGRVGVEEAVSYAFITGLVGLSLLLLSSNILTTSLAFLSLVLYAFVYTPLKKVGVIAVFIGAIPGALPPLLGWTAVSGTLTHEAFIIFALQFMWQFPHFWAIAWVLDEDYSKAGFKLLPSSKGKDSISALNIIFYTLLLIPFGLLPYNFHITGEISAWVVTISSVLFAIPTFLLLKSQSRKAALQIMFGSFIYLPIVQIALLLDKI